MTNDKDIILIIGNVREEIENETYEEAYDGN